MNLNGFKSNFKFRKHILKMPSYSCALWSPPAPLQSFPGWVSASLSLQSEQIIKPRGGSQAPGSQTHSLEALC